MTTVSDAASDRGVALKALLTVLLMAGPADADITPQRQTELMNLLTQDCGSCHGSTMQGGLGPALTPQSLSGKPAGVLRDVILRGRPGTPMPPWAEFLSEQEADWLVQVLRRGINHGQ